MVGAGPSQSSARPYRSARRRSQVPDGGMRTRLSRVLAPPKSALSIPSTSSRARGSRSRRRDSRNCRSSSARFSSRWVRTRSAPTDTSREASGAPWRLGRLALGRLVIALIAADDDVVVEGAHAAVPPAGIDGALTTIARRGLVDADHHVVVEGAHAAVSPAFVDRLRAALL